jgi:hypothetical protein
VYVCPLSVYLCTVAVSLYLVDVSGYRVVVYRYTIAARCCIGVVNGCTVTVSFFTIIVRSNQTFGRGYKAYVQGGDDVETTHLMVKSSIKRLKSFQTAKKCCNTEGVLGYLKFSPKYVYKTG